MQIVYRNYNTIEKKKAAPITQEWNNCRMIRNHSIRACVREILSVNMGIDVVKINLIGSPSTGKTTLARTIGHLIHELANTPFAVKVFNRADLMDMEGTLAKLQPMNHVLIFDDISWLSAGNSKQKLDQLQKTFTEVRHLPGGQDIKVIIIFNFHYNLSIPKHLRQANFFCYTDMGSSEIENTQKIVGLKNTGKILDFVRVVQEAQTTGIPATSETDAVPGTFSYKITRDGKKKFTYVYREPYAPALWWNRNSLRHIVFPAREWIQPICPLCTGSIEKTEKQQVDLAEFKKSILENFTIGIVRQGLRLKLYQHGINTWEPRVKQVMTYIDKYMEHKLFNFEDMAKEFDLTVKKTKMRKKLPDEIIDGE